MLYVLWHLLWNLWGPGTIYSKAKSIVLLLVFLVSVASFRLSIDFQHIDPVKWHYLGRLIFAGILFLIIQYAMRSQQHLAQLRLEKEQIQTENYKAQLQSIRTKIDPHFLFNSLNTLRSMVRQQHVNSEQFIMSLSDFYRQTLKYNENTTLPLSAELAVLESYVFLMKNRSAEAVMLTMALPALNPSLHLPTMALQVVVENCFKHNRMSSREPLQIEVSQTQEGYVEVKNNLQPKLSVAEPSGYGLELLQKRYELLAISAGVLIDQTTDSFRVNLKLIEK